MKKCAAVFLSLLTILTCTAPALAAQSSTAPVENARLPALEPIEPIAPNSAAPTPAPAIEPIEPVDPVPSSASEDETGTAQAVVRRSGSGTVRDLYQYWEENGYPDDVAYAYEAGGEMVGNMVYSWWEIGLVGNDPVRQEEILALAASTCLVEFKNALFSHGEKLAAYEKLLELAETDETILQVVFMRNSDTVWVAVPEDRAKEYAQYLIRDCGLGAVVSVTGSGSLDAIMDGNALDGAMTGGMETGGGLNAGPDAGAGLLPNKSAVPPAIWAGLIAAVCAAAVCAALAMRSFLVPSAVTAKGKEKQLRPSAPLSRRQAEKAVRDSTEPPGDALYQSILGRLSEEKPDDKDE